MTGLSFNQLSALKSGVKQAKLQKAQGTANAISIGGELAGVVISTVYAIKNEKLRVRLADEIDKLSQEQAYQLALRLQASTDENERLKALSDYLTDIVNKKQSQDITSSIQKKYLSGGQKTRKYIFWGLGISMTIIILTLIMRKKK